MKKLQGWFDGKIERLCLNLGRHSGWRRWLDGLGGLLVPPAVFPAFATPDRGSAMPTAFFQSGGAAPSARPAPSVPIGSPHSTECNKLRYHGMHGTPCEYNGGSERKCPANTVSGYWWTYDVPGLGVVYFVDCCGGENHEMASSVSVWCSWSNEQNWCGGRGKNIYTCTIALTHAELTKDSASLANPFFHVDVSDDDTVRDLVSSFGSDLATLTNPKRIELIKSLLAGWVSEDDMKAIEKILGAVPTAADMKAVRAGVDTSVMWSSTQKARVDRALRRL